MNTAARLCAYGAGVVLFGAGAFATGSQLDLATARPAAASPAAPTSTPMTEHSGMAVTAPPAAADQPAGLASSQNGYTLVPITTTLPAQAPTEIAFRITGPTGAPVTDFALEHDKRMHLIVVRSDTADFQHLHPTMSADGTWRVPVTLAGGGTYRAFADFSPAGGEAMTLRADLFAPGQFTPVAPQPNRVATTPGGYQVRLDGDLVPGRSSPVTLTVTRDGRPVTDLQPYLGAYGHLVALRGGDLAYLHVHPHGEPGDGTTQPGPAITFSAQVPTIGIYRLFLDFQHQGQVHTVEFTVPTTGDAPAPRVDAPASVPSAPAGDSHAEGGH